MNQALAPNDQDVPLLSVRNLSKSFKIRQSWLNRKTLQVQAVDGISFDISAGSTMALVGESGCGKSTTAKLILRLIDPDSGEIFFDGQPVTQPTSQLRQAIQMVFQDPYASLTPHFKIQAILREPLVVHKICPKSEMSDRIISAVSAVGLPADVINRFPHELSGGQRQRISIARALAVDPKIIICDEPVSALDLSIRSQIINLLLDIQKNRNLAYLFISHDLDLVAHVSDFVSVMYLGQIIEQASTDRFFAGPRHPYSKALLASSLVADPKKRVKLAPLKGEVASPTDLPTGCNFRTRCAMAVEKCVSVEPPLQQVYNGHLVACHRAEELASSNALRESM